MCYQLLIPFLEYVFILRMKIKDYSVKHVYLEGNSLCPVPATMNHIPVPSAAEYKCCV